MFIEKLSDEQIKKEALKYLMLSTGIMDFDIYVSASEIVRDESEGKVYCNFDDISFKNRWVAEMSDFEASTYYLDLKENGSNKKYMFKNLNKVHREFMVKNFGFEYLGEIQNYINKQEEKEM